MDKETISQNEISEDDVANAVEYLDYRIRCFGEANVILERDRESGDHIRFGFIPQPDVSAKPKQIHNIGTITEPVRTDIEDSLLGRLAALYQIPPNLYEDMKAEHIAVFTKDLSSATVKKFMKGEGISDYAFGKLTLLGRTAEDVIAARIYMSEFIEKNFQKRLVAAIFQLLRDAKAYSHGRLGVRVPASEFDKHFSNDFQERKDSTRFFRGKGRPLDQDNDNECQKFKGKVFEALEKIKKKEEEKNEERKKGGKSEKKKKKITSYAIGKIAYPEQEGAESQTVNRKLKDCPWTLEELVDEYNSQNRNTN